MLDETAVRRWLYGHGLLREPKKQEPAVSGGPPVEAECELVQVVVQMCRAHSTLMGPEQPTLEQRDDAVHPWQTLRCQVVSSSQQRDPMAIALGFQPVVAVPPIGMHEAARRDHVLHKGVQAVGGPIG